MQTAQNTFNGGLLMDLNPMTVPNSVLTDCLNGTLITFNGNEFVLQNDMGNGRVETCRLKKDFIPLGMKEYGGVIYIVSQNPFTGECEIGSFPSPERIITDDELGVNGETILKSDDFYKGGFNSDKGVDNPYLKLDLGNILLRPGDKFLVYVKNDDNSLSKFEELATTTNTVEDKLFTIHLTRVTEQGLVNNIDTVITEHNKERFYYTQPQYNNLVKNSDTDDFYTVYSDRLNGYLAVVVEVIQDVDYSVDIRNIKKNTAEGKTNTFWFNFEVKSVALHKNNIVGVEVLLKEKDITVQKSEEALSIGSGDDKGTNEKLIKIDNLELDKTYILEVTPYSKYQLFNNLKYTLSVDYTSLTTNKSSTIWKYKTSEYVDENQDPYRATTLTFDLFLRGSLNERNRPSVVYLELYDIVSDASLIYPLERAVSGLNTIQIPHFYKSGGSGSTFAPYYEWGSEEYIGDSLVYNNTEQARLRLGVGLEIIPQTDNDYYYILLDNSKKNLYIKARQRYKKPPELVEQEQKLLYIEGKSNEFNTGKEVLDRLCEKVFSQGPCCIKVRPELTERYRTQNVTSYMYNNTELLDSEVDGISRNNRLRDNNLYICRICALDINRSEGAELKTEVKGSAEGDYRCIEYNIHNLLWTNGIYNTREGDNFNTSYSQDNSYVKMSTDQNTAPIETVTIEENREGYSRIPVSESELSEYRYLCKCNQTSKIKVNLNKINTLRYGFTDTIHTDITKDISNVEYTVTELDKPLLPTESSVELKDITIENNSVTVYINSTSTRGIISETKDSILSVNKKQFVPFREYSEGKHISGISSLEGLIVCVMAQSSANHQNGPEGVWINSFPAPPPNSRSSIIPDKTISFQTLLNGGEIMQQIHTNMSKYGSFGLVGCWQYEGGDDSDMERVDVRYDKDISMDVHVFSRKNIPSRKYLLIFLNGDVSMYPIPDVVSGIKIRERVKTTTMSAVLPIAIKINGDGGSSTRCNTSRHVNVLKVFNEFLNTQTYVMWTKPVEIKLFIPSNISKSKNFDSTFSIKAGIVLVNISGYLQIMSKGVKYALSTEFINSIIEGSSIQYNKNELVHLPITSNYNQTGTHSIYQSFNTNIPFTAFVQYISNEYKQFVSTREGNIDYENFAPEDEYKNTPIGWYCLKYLDQYYYIGMFENYKLGKVEYYPSYFKRINDVRGTLTPYIAVSTGSGGKYNTRPIFAVASNSNFITLSKAIKTYFNIHQDQLDGAIVVDFDSMIHNIGENCNS